MSVSVSLAHCGLLGGIGLESGIMTVKRKCQHCGRALKASKRTDALYCDARCRRAFQRAAASASRKVNRWSREFRSQSVRSLASKDDRTANALIKARGRFKRGDLGVSNQSGIGIYDVGPCRVVLRTETGPILVTDTYDMAIEFD